MVGVEGVEGLMKKLQLSEVEKRGLKLGWVSGDQVGMIKPKAMGKLLSEKPAHTEGLTKALGRIWCPMRGITCKTMGDNVFLFTFHQVSGKRKAVEDGPWMFDDELIVMEDFDEDKGVDEYKFESIPIWVRIFNLPVSRMNRDTGEAMGDVIGKFIPVEVGDDGMAFGQYLRVKVRLMLDTPLMRGMMIQVGESGREKWCRFEYEYLPDFCFTCGIIGHTDKGCSIQLRKGEVQQYGIRLKCDLTGKASKSGEWGSRGNSRYFDPR
ncbi:hypothetical protein ACQ4PT_064801 [Festuca glaucescens]